MKRTIQSALWISVFAVFLSSAALAVLPQPALYIPFNADWDCQTLSGSDAAEYTLYKNYAPYSDAGVWGNALRFNPAAQYTAGGSLYYPDGGYADAVLDSGLEQFTICGWFRSDSVPVNAVTLLVRQADSGTAGPGYVRILFDAFGRLRLIVNDVWEDQLHWYATEKTWTFFAVTYDGSASTDNVTWYYATENNAVYVQAGATATHGSLAGGSLAASDSPLVIGDDSTVGAHTYDGTLDEIRLYNMVLTAGQVEEVRQLINSPEPTDSLFDPANTPEPLVYLPYDGGWNNQGTAGESEVTVLSGYDEGTNTLTGPSFAEGVRGQCLDLSMRTSQVVFEEKGGIRYDDNDDPNAPMKAALNGLRSFTVCGWMKVDQTNLGNGSSPFFFQRRDNQLYEYKIRFQTDQYGRPKSILNHVSGPWTPYAWWNMQPASGWQFKAYTYNADDFGQEEKWYYAQKEANGALRAIRPQSVGLLENSNEAVHLFPAYDGFADEVYLFGSKTDGSGALTLEQIQLVASRVHRNFVCGTEGYAVPEGDTNADCVVDITDVKNLGLNWLFAN